MAVFGREFKDVAPWVLRRFGWALVVLETTACASRHDQLIEFVRSHDVEVATGHYTVHPPDALVIHAPNILEIDGALPTVRPDGKIVLRLLGEIDVAGLTTSEINAKLKMQLSRYYVEPEVLVDVASFRSEYYYIFGEVSSPGPRPFTGRDTLLKALAEAQPTYLAWRAQIRIMRPMSNPEDAKAITVNLDQLVRNGDGTQDILLQPGDVIDVPPTPLAWVGHRIREVMYPVTPLINAYTAPTTPITTTHTYEEELGSNDTNGSQNRRWPQRY